MRTLQLQKKYTCSFFIELAPGLIWSVIWLNSYVLYALICDGIHILLNQWYLNEC